MNKDLRKICSKLTDIHKTTTLLYKYSRAYECSEELYYMSSTLCHLSKQTDDLLHSIRLILGDVQED